MKTATLPSLRVKPALRKAAKDMLREGESPSIFMEQSLVDEVNHRRAQAGFIASGLAARKEAKRTGVYYNAEESLAAMDEILVRHKPAARRASTRPVHHPFDSQAHCTDDGRGSRIGRGIDGEEHGIVMKSQCRTNPPGVNCCEPRQRRARRHP